MTGIGVSPMIEHRRRIVRISSAHRHVLGADGKLTRSLPNSRQSHERIDDMRMKPVATLALAALAVASPAAANHIFNPGPYESRGDCEAESAALSNEDRDQLLDRFPQLFSSEGEVASFLNRAFTCDLNLADGEWYITDHRQEVINSDWFQRRL